MSRLIKIVDNKYVQIEEYKNPSICFNTNEYDNFEDYCTLRETFDPFEIFYENQELKDKLSKIESLIINHNCDTGDIYYKYNSKFLKSELKQRILEIIYKGSDNNE